MRNPPYAPNSRSGATIAHPSITSRCHHGRALRSPAIVPLRSGAPPAPRTGVGDRKWLRGWRGAEGGAGGGKRPEGFIAGKAEPQLDSRGSPTHHPMSTAAAIVTAAKPAT